MDINARYKYDTHFFDYIEHGAIASARHITLALESLGIRSVLDVGCGRGAWLSAWINRGVATAIGVDGAYVDRDRLLIPRGDFHAVDVARHFDLGRQFDLVQCLEVGEHLPTERSPMLIENLTRHGTIVLFSAASPGQGGEHHINEQPASFWRHLFRDRGFHPVDCLRFHIMNQTDVEPWYKYNTLLYVRADHLEMLPPDISAHLVPEHIEITNLAPLSWRIRCAMLRQLPIPVVSKLAVMKHHFILLARGRHLRRRAELNIDG